ncbi:hypothetical protein [Malikia spinosa]|jgi:hypothetical protein|uniref:hypothetical protein n=1 Tax=Malikia spinosa TaxID=86180 RepID=UPI00136F83B8|nr:hypothetical protein [Malikia spinosa]
MSPAQRDLALPPALRKSQQSKDWLAFCLSGSLADAARLRCGIYGLIRHNESEIQQK